MNIYEEEALECTTCAECGYPIYYGETFYRIPCGKESFDYCEGCMSEFRTTEDYEEPDFSDEIYDRYKEEQYAETLRNR